MTLAITHTKVSGIADDPAADAAGEVLPSHWNADHTLTGTASIAQGGTGATDAATARSNLGAGTVTSVSVTTANGVSGSVATATSTPAISLTLGAITPTSVAAVGTVTGSNLSGTNTGDQTITLTGGVTGSGTGSFAATVITNANLTGPVTSTGNATAIANGAISNAMLANSAVANLSGTNTGDQTSVSGNAGTVTVADAGGDTTTWVLLGTSQTGSLAPATDGALTYNATTNALSADGFIGALTGNASTATALQNARTIGGVSFDGTGNIVPQTIQSVNEATDTTCFPLFISASGSQSLQPLNNTALKFNANTGEFGSTSFTGAGTGLTGTAASLTAGTVTTNANLTGAVTSSGNATSLGSFTSANLAGALTDETGSGAAVFATSPTLVTPLLGTPTSGTLTNCTGYTDANLSTSDITTNNVSTTKHGFAPKLPNDATKYLDGTGAYTAPGAGATTNNYFGSLVYSNTSVPAGNTTTSTSETAFNSSYTISAANLSAGDVVQVKLWGVYSGTVLPTIRGKIKWGSTVMLDTTAISGLVTGSNLGWFADAYFVVQSTGASGAVDAQGFADFETAATTSLSVNTPNASAITIDTTAAQAITATIQWGAGGTGQTITLRQMQVHIHRTNSGLANAVSNGGTGVTSLTAYAPIFGGTTSTGAVQSGTVGTSGQVLTSNGAGVLPTFQAAAGGASIGLIYEFASCNIPF